ncbi:MAG: Sapep family Mn(2+)-dependent dipeptidase [Clostridia bacterium]|nr:Sapep family Mn(2+)-dependent dipeptidase [Clostridia bacterium]
MAHITEKYFDEIVEKTAEIVRFDSSLKPAEGEFPFGKETADCLQYFLNLASSFGFETKNYDNYVGEVVFGEGEPFAILAHLDVVPAGKGWKYPPFGGVINDDVSDGGMTGKKIWGRGTMDDKGPAVATLYALKALKDEGFTPNRKIQFILGCNEESGWACIDHYNQVAKMPEEGISPDANFPAIYAEGGILHFTAKFPIENPPFLTFTGGEKVNMVCDEAEATVTETTAKAFQSYQNSFAGVTLFLDEENGKITAKGKSAHGSTPQMGANAMGGLLQFFATQNPDCKKAYDILFDDVLALKTIEDQTGVLTMSPDVVSFENGVLSVTVDVRFPATKKKEDVLSRLDNAKIPYGNIRYQAPLYNDPNGKLVSVLMSVYNQATGGNEPPIAIGGGTYARALKNGCAFGPEMPGEEATIHQPNEYVTFDNLRFMTKMYYEAIKKLTE